MVEVRFDNPRMDAEIGRTRSPGPSQIICYHGPRRCTWEHRYCFENSYGDYACRVATTSAGAR